MALLVRKISEITRVNALLRGGIFGSVDLRKGLVYGLHGKTLIFTAPAATVTFTTPNSSAQDGLTLSAILEQINDVAALDGWVKAYEGALLAVDPAGSTAVVLDKDGTANTIFGFQKNVDTAGVVYAAPGGAAPALVSVDPIQYADLYVVTTEEA